MLKSFSGLQKFLNQQGFNVIGLSCTTCIGNSGELDESVASAISENDIVAADVLSGNRNFEGRTHPLTRANYLASPPLVVAYALAGTTAGERVKAKMKLQLAETGESHIGNFIFCKVHDQLWFFVILCDWKCYKLAHHGNNWEL